MNGEIEPTARGSVEPYKPNASISGDDVPVPYVPMQNSGRYDVPDYVDLRPPSDTEFEEWWSKIVTPFRGLALVFLWLTYRWWRFAVFVITIVLIILVIKG